MPDHISKRLAGLGDSATMAITARAAELRASGANVIGFGAGEPDFPTPEHVVAAAQEAAADPRNHRYSPAAGLPELRDAVAASTTAEVGIPVGVEQVTITNGAKGAVFGTMAALLEPGDEVIVPSPFWVTYPAAAAFLGAVMRPVPTSEDGRFRVTPGALDAVRTDRTKLLIISSPCNPTGTVYTSEELTAIGEWAVENRLWVLSDDIYRSFVYGSAEYTSMLALVPDLADRFVMVDGVSKAFAMTGWRVGWLIAPPDVAAASARLQSHSTSNVSNVSQRAALAAVTGPRLSVAAMVEAFARRRKTMHAMLSAIEGVTCVEPEGAFYAFPSVAGLLGRPLGDRRPRTAAELAAALLDEARIAVVPGEAFGAAGHLRLSFALDHDDMIEGLERLREAVEQPPGRTEGGTGGREP